mgnify:CR=1 FL=1
MSIKVSSGISLSTNYFLRNFYTNNQKAAKTSGRSGYSNVELSYEDSRALNRAAKRLSKSDFGSDTDEKDDDLNETSQAAIDLQLYDHFRKIQFRLRNQTLCQAA